MTEIVGRFGISADRLALLRGLLAYRSALKQAGIVQGFQWLDGSFVEDCETIRQRAPHDIDIVTFAYRPRILDWSQFLLQHSNLFDLNLTKALFMCDAYYIDLQKPPLVSDKLLDEALGKYALTSKGRKLLSSTDMEIHASVSPDPETLASVSTPSETLSELKHSSP